MYVSVDEKRESKKLAAVIIATGGKALSGKNVSLCPQSYHQWAQIQAKKFNLNLF